MEYLGNALYNATVSPFRAAGDALFSPWKGKNPRALAKVPLSLANTAAYSDDASADREIKRSIQMKKAFTLLRDDLSADAPSAKTNSPAKSPSRKPAGGPKKAISKSPAKVKSEPMRRSRRTRAGGYKKGQYSEGALAKKAWAGQGTADSPISL